MMGKLIIKISPQQSSIEIYKGIVIKAGAPYSPTQVTITINPGVDGYEEDASSENVEVKQVTVTSGGTALNAVLNKQVSINVKGIVYHITLVKVTPLNPGWEFEFDIVP